MKDGPVDRPENSLLSKFHYLSTVSGGGYTGGWLAAWCKRSGFSTVCSQLVQRAAHSGAEPSAITWLRSYSNYLTPKLGRLSADSWTVVAIYVRNLILNWLVILPLLCAFILSLKTSAVLLFGIATKPQPVLSIISGTIGVLLLIAALAFTTRHRPSRQYDKNEPNVAGKQMDQIAFLWGSVLVSLLSAIAIVQCLGSDSIGCLSETPRVDSEPDQIACGMGHKAPLADPITGKYMPKYSALSLVSLGALSGCAIYSLGWLCGRPRNHELKDFLL